MNKTEYFDRRKNTVNTSNKVQFHISFNLGNVKGGLILISLDFDFFFSFFDLKNFSNFVFKFVSSTDSCLSSQSAEGSLPTLLTDVPIPGALHCPAHSGPGIDELWF